MSDSKPVQDAVFIPVHLHPQQIEITGNSTEQITQWELEKPKPPQDPKTGKFISVKPVDPQKKYKKHMNTVKNTFMRCVTIPDIQKMVRVAVDVAMEPNALGHASRMWIFDRLLGKAPQHLTADVETNMSPEEVQQKIDIVLGIITKS